jgi:DNA mismatch repair protein MutL
MPKIKPLSEELINKIAAGEVIERPASVVKELIENALDAHATSIHIDISDCGKKLIRVTDNGEGMDEDDALQCLQRHATSKLTSDNDLFNITTLGFRGEALASIAAVSQLSLITKQEEEIQGFNIVVEGGREISKGVIAAQRGTIVEVRNLFFNTPARKKFMKTDAVELRHIVDIVTNYALGNPQCSFVLQHENHQLINSPAADDLRNKIASIYSINLAKELLEVKYDNELGHVTGYICPPQQCRNDKSQQVLFLNGRWVKNKDVVKAVYDGYHSMLFVGKHPIFVLFLEVNPQKVDVNVHPQKSEIKIEQAKELENAVQDAIRLTLEKNNLIPIMKFEYNQETIEPKYQFEETTQAVLQRPIVEEYSTPEEEILQKEPIKKQQPVEVPKRRALPPMRLLGQVHKTFFVAETLDGMYYIDQHAAHERVLYEKFMHQHAQQDVKVQRLLKGEVIEFTAAEGVLVEENKTALLQMGFFLEDFGDYTYVLKTIPLLFGRVQPKEIIYDVLSMLKEGKSKLAETREEIVTRMACRSAVMAGQVLTIHEMEAIMEQLAYTKLPFTCPHGRPTVIKVTVDELERKFKRKS